MLITAPHRAALFVVAVLLSSLAGCTESAEQYLQQTQAFHVIHDYKSALIQVKNVLAEQPDNGEARFLLGTIYNQTAEFGFAEIELRRAQTLNYEPVRVLAALGGTWAGQGNYKKVLDELSTFQQERGQLPPELLNLQGNVRLALQRADASSSFEAALQQSPSDASAHLGLARVALVAGKMDRAVQETDLALSHAPKSVEAWLFKGDLMLGKRASADAELAYRNAAAIDPNDPSPHLRLADFYSNAGKLESARTEINAVRKGNPRSLEAMYQLAVLHVREKKYAEADAVIQQVLKVAPNSMKSVLVAGTTAFHLGKTELADNNLSRYLKRFPDDVYARKLLAANLLQANQPAQAMAVLKPLLTRTGDVQTLAIAGNAARRNNDFAKASEYLTQAVALAPSNAALRTELGVTRLTAGDTEHAISDLESAARLEGGAPKSDYLLISTYLRSQDYDKALAAIEILAAKQPNNPATFNLRGIAQSGKNQYVAARASFEKALVLKSDYFSAANNLTAQELHRKDFDAAREHLLKFLQNNPTSTEAMVALADIAGFSGDDKGRQNWLEKAVKSSPTAIQPRALLAAHHADRNDLPKALRMAREIQSAHPDDVVVLNLLGSLQLAAGDKDDATNTYTALVRLAPKSPPPLYRLALLQVDSKNWTAARQSLLKVLMLEPKHVEAQVALTAMELKAGRPAEALKFAQQVRRDDSKSAVGPVLEGDVRMAQDDYRGALLAYDAGLGIAPTNSALFMKAHSALVRAGNTKEADVRAARWVKSQSGDNIVRIYLADADTHADKILAAIQNYQVVLQTEPNNVLVLNNLAGLYQRQNDSRALATAEQAYKLRDGDPVILDTLGWILVQQGDRKRGVSLLQQAVATSAHSPLRRYHLAVAYVRSGDKEKAREMLDALIESDSAFPERAEVLALRKQL